MPVFIARELRLALISLLLLVAGCSTNPVTGESQLMFTSFADDVAIGEAQYGPAQQSQGGEYYLDPGLNDYVRRVGNKLVAVSDQSNLPYEFVVLNNSIPNAWALPSGKIAINRGLLVKLENEAQLAAVLSHEIVHAAARHGAQKMRDNLLLQAGVAGLGLTLADNDFRGLIIGGASLGASMTLAKYGRDHELESDKYGMKYMAKAGYDLQGAVQLQKIFLQLSKGRNPSWFEGLFASHPPSQERVEENIASAQELGGGNFLGLREFESAMRYLRSKQPAYDLADKAAAALQKQQLDQALKDIEQAIKIEPKEALFATIQGEIYLAQGKAEKALAAQNRAIELYPRQFSYYLNRAAAYQSLGKLEYAKENYERSMELLPTSVAALEIGKLLEQLGEASKARPYYEQAANAQGSYGQEARSRLATLELNENPQKYLRVVYVQDPNGPLLAYIENASPLKLQQVTVSSQLLDASGKAKNQAQWSTSEGLEANARSRYYAVPVTNHVAPNESIRTTITSVKIHNDSQ